MMDICEELRADLEKWEGLLEDSKKQAREAQNIVDSLKRMLGVESKITKETVGSNMPRDRRGKHPSAPKFEIDDNSSYKSKQVETIQDLAKAFLQDNAGKWFTSRRIVDGLRDNGVRLIGKLQHHRIGQALDRMLSRLQKVNAGAMPLRRTHQIDRDGKTKHERTVGAMHYQWVVNNEESG